MTVKDQGPIRPAGAQLAQYGAVSVSLHEDQEEGSRGGSEPSGEGRGIEEPDSWVKAHDVELVGDDPDDASPKFQDKPFAVLFLVQLAAMIYLGVARGSWGAAAADRNDDRPIGGLDEEAETHLSRVVCYLVMPSVAISFVLAFLGAAVVIPASPVLAVATCLVSSLISTGIVCLLVILAAPGALSIIGMVALFALNAWYVRRVWCLIPFAAANLVTALRGVSANWGTYIVALVFTAVSGVWAVFWMYAANGVFLRERAEDEAEANDDEAESKVHWGPLFLLLVSLYWTTMVLLNIIQTTVAGVVGTWCFAKDDAASCCSPAVTSSLYRSCTYSFGSICLGSLMDAVVKALRVMSEMAKNRARDSDDECSGGAAVLFCILECILRIFEDVIEYFNQWAYVFVGIYGYSYIESGRKVMELFRARGWTAILTDDLVGYVLNFTAMAVAVLTGVFAVLIEGASRRRSNASYLFGDAEGAKWAAFLIGFLLGLLVSAVMMNVIKGAVNTVIVCYADAPAKLEENHPKLTYQMAVAWVSVFPDCGVRVPPKEPAVATVMV